MSPHVRRAIFEGPSPPIRFARHRASSMPPPGVARFSPLTTGWSSPGLRARLKCAKRCGDCTTGSRIV